MKIRKEDYQDILQYLQYKQESSREYVAFFEGAPVEINDLFSFYHESDAKKFCSEVSKGTDTYDYLVVSAAKKAMTEAIENNTLLIEKDGLVDVSLMVSEWYQRLFGQFLKNNQNTKIMNQKNFEYLRDQVKYTGFGEGLENALKQKIEEGQPQFQLQHQQQYGNDSVTAILNFSQSKQSDMYFFNSYQVSLQKESNRQKMEQSFYINRGNTITLKEAYNLMEGRSVNKLLTSKEGEVYNAWIQMDFKESNDNGNFKLKHYHQNYGYDLEATLMKHPIRELSNESYKSALMDSLKKGNRQSATFLINGAEQKQYIEANPQFKTINIYDGNMQRVDNRQSKKEQKSESESQSVSVKQDDKKEKVAAAADDDEPEIPKASNKKKKRQSIS